MARNTGRRPAFARSTRLVALGSGVLLMCAGILPAAHAAAVDTDGDGDAAGDCAPLDPSVGPHAQDLPDLAFTDTNCDGIDGNAATAVFVAPDGSDDNPGTQAQPLRTLQAAVDQAATGGRQVYAAVGSYDTRVVFATNHDGVQVYGGYERETFRSRTTSLPTTVSGQPDAVLADGATDIVLQLVHLRATRGTSLSAYGIRAVNGSEVALVASSVSAGPGGAGQPGTHGSTPAKAASGAAGGNPVNCDTPGVAGNSSQSGPGTDGGAGGTGGQETNDGEPGQAGTRGGGTGGGTPGAGGVDTAGDTSPAGHGQNGSPGQPGTAG
ncbi:MAG: hypothetical protein M3237_22045, partial [Actinomycetota bacterium]|nr:hypothetical protein [Actinomycetota bacterium]